MDMINSKVNNNVKFVRSLNEKKFRIKNRAFYLEGIKVVNEVLDKEGAINIMFIAYSKSMLLNSNGGEQILKRIGNLKNIKIIEFDESIFKYVTDTVTPQGILIVLSMVEHSLEELKSINSNILVLDKIQDQGNLGTIIRSCNAFNIEYIICMSGTADVYSPKTLRSTMGAILNTKIIYIKDRKELEKLNTYGFKIVTTSLNSNNYINSLDYNNKYAFVMGNEANGVSKEIEEMSQIIVKIPMSDKIESLNVGVATSIILYEQYKNKNI